MKHQFDIITTGVPLQDAEKALIMIHGRGGSATDILSIASHLQVADYALLAPQATAHSWYPHSFIAPVEDNERSEEHTSELQSRENLVCRLLLEKKND